LFWLSYDSETFLKVRIAIFVISMIYYIGLDNITIEFEKNVFSTLPNQQLSRIIFLEKSFLKILNNRETLFHSEFDADSEYMYLRSQFSGAKRCFNTACLLHY
jgi:hypothetical protein